MMKVIAIKNTDSDSDSGSEIEINFRSIPFSGNRPIAAP